MAERILGGIISAEGIGKHYDNPMLKNSIFMWNTVKQQILDSMDEHIPSKMIHLSKHQAGQKSSLTIPVTGIISKPIDSLFTGAV